MRPNEVKILHCADLHLGAEFSTLGEKGAQRKREVFQALEKIVSICDDEGVEFLLIAGDLFDHLHIDPQMVSEVMAQFVRIPDTIVAIAPGNHDPFSIDSCYSTQKWPENVVIFSNERSCILFEDKNVCLWGDGFHSTYHPDSFFSLVPGGIDEERIHLCCIHGDVVPQGQNSLYNPILREQIRQSGFDYVALGHVHKRTTIQKEGKTAFAYSGSPEGHGFDEPGEQGIYIGTVSKNRHSLQFRKICRRSYHEVPVSITGALTHSDIAALLLEELEKRFGEEIREHLYKIVLKGEIPGSFLIDLEVLAQRIASHCFYAKIENQTALAVDYESLAREQTLKGIFVRNMLDCLVEVDGMKDESRLRIAQNALQAGLRAFDCEVVTLEN